LPPLPLGVVAEQLGHRRFQLREVSGQVEQLLRPGPG
jgi:hypothetical protein